MKAKKEYIFVLSIDGKLIAASNSATALSNEIGISPNAVYNQVKRKGAYRSGGTIIESVLVIQSQNKGNKANFAGNGDGLRQETHTSNSKQGNKIEKHWIEGED